MSSASSRTRTCARTSCRPTSPRGTPPRASATASRPTKAIFDDKKLQKDLKNAAESFRDASVALREAPKQRKGLSFGRLLLLTVVSAGVALAVSEGLRKKVLDALFGAEEEFEYTSTDHHAAPGGGGARRRPARPRAPRPAAAGYPRGSRPRRRPRSRVPSRRRRAPSASVTRLAALSLAASMRSRIFSIRFSAHLNSSASMPSPRNTIAQPGPGSGISASPPIRITKASDHEQHAVGHAALDVALAAPRQLLGQRQVVLGGDSGCSRHSPAMKSRTSTSAPGRSAVSAPWRASQAPGGTSRFSCHASRIACVKPVELDWDYPLPKDLLKRIMERFH